MRRAGGLVLLAVALLASTGCGYRPLYASTTSEPLAVTGVRAPFADASIEMELRAGARSELARAGRLRSGDDWPRLVVEAIRVEEATDALARHGSEPSARASRIRLVARAWIERDPDSIEGDTGEVVAESTVAVEERAMAASWRETLASRAAARKLGEELARRVLGFVGSGETGM